MNWISIKSRLPIDESVTVLARGTTHGGVALATYSSCENRWDVQPFKEAWYYTCEGITHWCYLGSGEKESEDFARYVISVKARVDRLKQITDGWWEILVKDETD